MNLLINSDARNIPLADGSVNCVVTSPPYYGLRDYGTAEWIGGDPECDHIVGLDSPRSERPLGSFHGGSDLFHTTPYRDVCGKCGATRIDKQIGLEQSPDEYVEAMVLVGRQLWRVLRDDGTWWLNLGDSYAGGGGSSGHTAETTNCGRKTNSYGAIATGGKTYGLKPKDLIGIPWRVAFALQADGWWLRQDIIWAKACSGDIRKGSAMPESVTDRFQKSHEYVFLLTKSQRYYFDNEAVKDTVDNPETHEYNYQYENKDMYSMQDGEVGGDVQCQQSAIRWTDGLLQGLSENNTQGVGSEIQCQQEGAGNGKAVLLFEKGSSDEEGISGELRTNRGTTRDVSESGEETRKGGEVQGSTEAIRSERKRENNESDTGQAVRQDGQGSLRKTQNSNQEELSDKDNRLHVNKGGLGGNQERIQEQMRLLRSKEEVRDGSRDSVEQRGDTHKGECGPIVSDVQRQEGRKVAGNRRSVWLINTANYPGSHFATFPPDLIEPCILAGCPETVCAECGAPYERVVESKRLRRNELPKSDPRYRPDQYHGAYEDINGKGDAGYNETKTLGWQPTCTCNAGTKPGVVLDPFVGSGTTCMVARKHRRNAIGLDLNFEYLNKNARERLVYGSFVEVGDNVKQLTIGAR